MKLPGTKKTCPLCEGKGELLVCVEDDGTISIVTFREFCKIVDRIKSEQNKTSVQKVSREPRHAKKAPKSKR